MCVPTKVLVYTLEYYHDELIFSTKSSENRVMYFFDSVDKASRYIIIIRTYTVPPDSLRLNFVALHNDTRRPRRENDLTRTWRKRSVALFFTREQAPYLFSPSNSLPIWTIYD